MPVRKTRGLMFIFISANEVMFLPLCVVCVTVSGITPKVVDEF